MTVSGTTRRYAHWWLDRCFLYVGRMSATKGMPEILQAWLELADQFGPTCPALWLVGGEPLEIEAIRQTIDLEKLNVQERAGKVKWWGYLDAAGISTLMLKAYVLVTHSRYEPGGRVVLEAMAQGIPVIATPNGFGSELVVDWHTGFLVSYGDVDGLRQRLAHFVSQPLLRHAMGLVAQQTAKNALKQWNFMETHLDVYNWAARRAVDEIENAATRPLRCRRRGPAPRGFGCVYPFEGESVDVSKAASFFTARCGDPEGPLTELPHESGRSRLWVASRESRWWVIKNAFSAYRRRPIWDLGFNGSAVETQISRVSAEMIASNCKGAARVVAVNAKAGLILREWFAPVKPTLSKLGVCVQLLGAFHASQPPSIDLDSIRTQLDREWRVMDDEEVLRELNEIESDFRLRGHPWHAWQPLCLRLGWRWLELGLARHWLSLPSDAAEIVLSWLDEESGISEAVEKRVRFGLCHGDGDPSHFRRDGSGEMVLIDCERLHPGYFGPDWATLIVSMLDQTESNSAWVEVIECGLGVVTDHIHSTRLLLSWLRWITAMDLCRAYGLLENDSIAAAELRRHRLQDLWGTIAPSL